MRKVVFAFSALCMAASASAERTVVVNEPADSSPMVTVVVGDKNSADDVELEFVRNAPKRATVPGLPRFAIVGHDNKFYMGIGAQFQGEAIYDFGDGMPSSFNFIPSSITPKTPGNGSQLRFAAQTSSIYLNAVALPGTENRVGLFFKASIHDGNSYGFHVSHFYATYRGLTAGLSSSIFTDDESIPYTIDNQGPNGTADMTVFNASYTFNLGKGFSTAVGIDAPQTDFTVGDGIGNVNQRCPSIPLYVQYAWNGDSHLRLSGIVRPMQYRNLIAEKNRTAVGWGVQLSGLATVVPKLTFYYSAVYGHGVANYLQDDNEMQLDAFPATGLDGHARLMRSFGAMAGLSYTPFSKLTFNAVYSHLTNMKQIEQAVAGSVYRYGDYIAANCMYTFNKIISAGLEYDYGHKKCFDGTIGKVNRLQAQLNVTF